MKADPVKSEGRGMAEAVTTQRHVRSVSGKLVSSQMDARQEQRTRCVIMDLGHTLGFEIYPML
jgi:hypothetical protein